MHVYDSRYPAAGTATLRPPDALVPDYRAVQGAMGTTRAVVVTPSTYGTDNRPTLAALRELGVEARGVAVVDTSITERELESLHASGIRGIRFNLTMPGPVDMEMLAPLAARVAPLGWHIQLNAPAAWLPHMQPLLKTLPARIVFDHYGHLPFGGAEFEPGFEVIASLLGEGRAWVKLSGPYIESREGPPLYGDVASLARRYLECAPGQMVWGSDWPHPTIIAKGRSSPDDGDLMSLFRQWCGDDALARQVLADNPRRLYGFGP
ncbi:amidohydrolase [Cupriavidus sp. UME77]|uniref:amidohydrolase family protein n=1 Tax=Cupriavidus sp. UME77 TaxID=1862321 RepID=UPI001600C75E|nr:amidohydrolase family protein [Cupriavidus sp. UME77]